MQKLLSTALSLAVLPFELISALVNGNQPGKKFELVEDKTDMDKRPLKVVRTVKPAREAGQP
jgi:hypothetical protein